MQNRAKTFAEVVDYFAIRSQGIITRDALYKLIYFANRECLIRYNYELIDDLFFYRTRSGVTPDPLLLRLLPSYSGRITLSGQEEIRSVHDVFYAEELSLAKEGVMNEAWSAWLNNYALLQSFPEVMEASDGALISLSQILTGAGRSRPDVLAAEIRQLSRISEIFKSVG